ncbi:TraR/DksA C4-type zinc finger protein [soil metagenome]
MSSTDVLIGLRARLQAQLSDAEAELGDIRGARSASTADDEHDPEGSTLTDDWSRAVGLREAAIAALHETDAALERVGDGTYGICVSCGRAIAPGRLEARPATPLCIACASR